MESISWHNCWKGCVRGNDMNDETTFRETALAWRRGSRQPPTRKQESATSKDCSSWSSDLLLVHCGRFLLRNMINDDRYYDGRNGHRQVPRRRLYTYDFLRFRQCFYKEFINPLVDWDLQVFHKSAVHRRSLHLHLQKQPQNLSRWVESSIYFFLVMNRTWEST